MIDILPRVFVFLPALVGFALIIFTLATKGQKGTRPFPSALAIFVATITLPSGLAIAFLLPQTLPAQPWFGFLMFIPLATAAALLGYGLVRHFHIARAWWGTALAILISSVVAFDLSFSVIVRSTDGRPVGNISIVIAHQNWALGYQEVETSTNSFGWAYIGCLRWCAQGNAWGCFTRSTCTFDPALPKPLTWPMRLTLLNGDKALSIPNSK